MQPIYLLPLRCIVVMVNRADVGWSRNRVVDMRELSRVVQLIDYTHYSQSTLVFCLVVPSLFAFSTSRSDNLLVICALATNTQSMNLLFTALT
jgi:hypothetical protein